MANFTDNELEILKKSELLKNFTDDVFLKFISMSSEVTFHEGEVLLKEGELSDALFILISGRVRLDKINKITSKAETIGSLGAGATLGEMRIIQNTACSLSAIASEDTTALCISIQQIRSNSFFYATILESVINIMSYRLYSTNELVANEITEKKRKKRHLFFSFFCIIILILFLFESGFLLYYTLNSSEFLCDKMNESPAQVPTLSAKDLP